MVERFYGRSTYLFTPVSPHTSLPGTPGVLSVYKRAFTNALSEVQVEIEPEHRFTQIRGGSSEISLRRFVPVGAASVSSQKLKGGREGRGAGGKERGDLAATKPRVTEHSCAQTTRIFTCPIKLHAAPDTRNATLSCIATRVSGKCHRLGGSGETRVGVVSKFCGYPTTCAARRAQRVAPRMAHCVGVE